MSRELLTGAIVRVLTAHSPATDEQLITLLEADGVDLGEDPGETFQDAMDETDDRIALLADDRWAWVPALLAGRVFTHRLADWEVEYDTLALTPDLESVAEMPDDLEGRLLADGSPVVPTLLPFDRELLVERGIPEGQADEDDSSQYLLLPRGYLTHLRAGDLIGLRLTDRGIVLEPVDENSVSSDTTRLGQALHAILDYSEPVESSVGVLTACADDASLFTQPLPPVSTMLARYGLVRHGDWLAGEGFDFAQNAEDLRLDELCHRHGVSDDQARAVLATVSLYEKRTEQVDDLVSSLSEPIVAYVVLAELDVDPDEADKLRTFAKFIEPAVAPRARPAARWLAAKAHELSGDLVAAEKTLLEAEKLDPTWSPVLLDLAEYASERGDAVRGLALAQRAGLTAGHPLFDVLKKFQPQPRPELGRNKPCWCGSGRKYKVCHLNSEQLPLDVRAAWLYQKAGTYADQDLLVELAIERSRYSGTWMQALSDPLVSDVAVFEGGEFAAFLATRGALLPDDERLLGEQWILIERSVFEIQQVRPGIGLTVRDLRTGDAHDVRERTASRQLTAGALVCARIVPAGDTMQIFGGLEPIGLRERDELIKLLDNNPDPVELVAFLTARFAPPKLVNTEGDPLAMCSATLSVVDTETLCDALDGTYERDEDGAREWLDLDSEDHFRARIRLDEQLHIKTNSENRLDRILDELRTLDPTLTIVDESREPTPDTRAATEVFGRMAPAGHPLGNADATSVMEQFILDYEQKWLDDSIPALAGRTPRQAADDPTRRDDLIRLLDSFPDDDNPATMSPTRIRAALDL
jgi:hypothetical protein